MYTDDPRMSMTLLAGMGLAAREHQQQLRCEAYHERQAHEVVARGARPSRRTSPLARLSTLTPFRRLTARG